MNLEKVYFRPLKTVVLHLLQRRDERKPYQQGVSICPTFLHFCAVRGLLRNAARRYCVPHTANYLQQHR